MGKRSASKHPSKSKRPLVNKAYNIYVILFCILCTASIYFYPALHNQLNNWDDNVYVTENPVITTWNTGILTARVNANWAPVFQFLLALEYHLFALNPAGFHITSLLLHLCNVVLVFLVLFMLSKKYLLAGIAALFFGIHPMHVESVAWVSEQKDLLFTFFYLGAMLAYIKYKEHQKSGGQLKTIYISLTMLLFILSCLSKGMGETLPIALVLIDCFLENNWNWKFIAKSVLSKIIFFLAAIGFGITAYAALQKGGALDIGLNHTIGQQIMFICYALIMYLVKFIIAFSPSALHLYPLKDINGNYPLIFYISPFIVALLAVFLFWILQWRRKKGLSNNTIIFGLLFFLANLVLVLQLKPLNFVILAERYTYLSYFGLLFIAADTLNNFWQKYSGQIKNVVITSCLLLAVTFWFTSYSYANVWYDSETLWTDTINKFRTTSLKNIEMVYNNRGLAYKEKGKLDMALTDYTMAISFDSMFDFAYNNRGLVYAKQRKFDLAVADYTKTISLNPKFFAPYYNRGLVYAKKNRPELAIADYNLAIALKPEYADIYNDRGLAYTQLGKFDSAIADYNTAIHLNERFMLPYYNRALVYSKIGKLDLAIADYSTDINWNPQDFEAYNNRGVLYAQQGKFDLAIADFNSAIGLNFQFGEAYYHRALVEEKKGNRSQAQIDFQKATSFGWIPNN
jgi:tetratricopeptide (TPR) repeat protein